ncbi:hypothetical protein FDP41_004447 [Naegleria fowleri]|uniref:Uncharacterized protein n=1 Tax=Naegleria fowleri TaxID=5763 RepID=A0A6A5BQP9_NAEFO|nr:uncharacterized protein FDP41_004447 [Naegleria fowleri]KAF0976548.1 hypothetical protein FDP41_004447 [Naegleria fowleri]
MSSSSTTSSSTTTQTTQYFPNPQKRQYYLNTYFIQPKKTIPSCNKCQSNEFVIPSVRGKPASSLLQDAEEGYVYLSGCCSSADGYCVKCKQVINERR